MKSRTTGVRVIILCGASKVPYDLKRADMFLSKLEPVEEIWEQSALRLKQPSD